MARFQFRRILPIILVILIIVIGVVILVSLARAIFFSGNTTETTTEKPDVTREALLDTTAGRSVSLTVRGPIVADENFRSYRISISPNQRKVQTFRGYLESTVDQKSLGNNVAAYEEFVYALDKANFTKGTQFEDEQNDIRGICASGRVYEFRLLKDGQPIETLWTSTCKGSKGSLEASADQLTSLFKNQVPDVNVLLRGVSL